MPPSQTRRAAVFSPDTSRPRSLSFSSPSTTTSPAQNSFIPVVIDAKSPVGPPSFLCSPSAAAAILPTTHLLSGCRSGGPSSRRLQILLPLCSPAADPVSPPLSSPASDPAALCSPTADPAVPPLSSLASDHAAPLLSSCSSCCRSVLRQRLPSSLWLQIRPPISSPASDPAAFFFEFKIAGRINTLIRDLKLRDLGKLEHDFIFGDAGAKELINFLRTNQNLSQENRLRLLMIYACVYPEKIEGDKGIKLMQLAKLSTEDMSTVSNLKYLGGLDTKKASGGSFSLKFDAQKKNHAARKEREDEEEAWQLSRFYPMIEELVEKLNKGELQKKEYPYMNEPALLKQEAEYASTSVHRAIHAPHSMRSKRTPTWAKQRASDDGNSSDSVLRHASSDFKRMGQRIFVFMIGGATRSELRSAHKLTAKIRREVIIGSSSLEDPPQFIKKLKLLSSKHAPEAAKQIPVSNFYF